MTVTLPKPSRKAAELYTRAKPLIIHAAREEATIQGLRASGDPPTVTNTLRLEKGGTIKLAIERSVSGRYVWTLIGGSGTIAGADR